jgi:hypothetical protein
MSTNGKATSFNLSPEQLTRLSELHSQMKEGTTWNEAFARVFDQGLYQLEYRYGNEAKAARKAYAKKHAAEVKEAVAFYKKAQTDPELAVKVGLGKRVEL